ncbi:MAG: hypothetical protein WD555_05630 [Fulvivirga sp.]
MKQFLLIVLGVAFRWNYCLAQCNPYYDFKSGSEWKLTSYNKNDQVTGRQVNILKSLEENSDGWTAQILFKSYDQKDELVFEKEMELACEAGIIKMDMERFIPEILLY